MHAVKLLLETYSVSGEVGGRASVIKVSNVLHI